MTSSLALIAGDVPRAAILYGAQQQSLDRNQGVASAPVFCHRTGRAVSRIRGLSRGRSRASGGRPRCRASYRPEQIQRVFDLIHLKYLAPNALARRDELPDPAIDAPQHHIRADHRGIWSTFVPPHARRAGGLKHYFAQTLALMRPSHASRVLGNFRRLAASIAELRIPRESSMSRSNSSFDTMTVKRTIRNGAARRYLISPSFLEQEFADGGQVTASHLRNIIRHLDDYV